MAARELALNNPINRMAGSSSPTPIDKLVSALESRTPVSGLTHRFYRYPARFSPDFVAAAIEAFTEPGDLILDPFAGGGTTAVEALARGRRIVATDINSLAGFVTRAKTNAISLLDYATLDRWHCDLAQFPSLRFVDAGVNRQAADQRNLPWRLRQTIAQALGSASTLATARQRDFAKATLLRTAQWALDCRASVPSRADFIDQHETDFNEMLRSAVEYTEAVSAAFGAPIRAISQNRRILVRSASGLDSDGRVPRAWGAPKLVLTSPPYMGVHILYHRWQVRGRRETAAPYWISGCEDGRPSTYYNFADRRRKEMHQYLDAMRAAYGSIVKMMDEASLLVQLVAFSNPRIQLPAFLSELESLGLEQLNLEGAGSSPIVRTVPNRKWYAKEEKGASTEYLLVHRRNTTNSH